MINLRRSSSYNELIKWAPVPPWTLVKATKGQKNVKQCGDIAISNWLAMRSQVISSKNVDVKQLTLLVNIIDRLS